MPTALTCPGCHHPLPSDAPRGLCPICLLKRALDDDPEVSGVSDEQPGRVNRSQTWNELCETVSFRAAKIPPSRPEAGKRGTVATPSVDLDQLIESLIELRLMEREEVRAFLDRFPIETRPGRAEHLARELVRARRLTEYQAGALLQGKSRGLSIGNYLILDKLGRGGMGMVFKAQHRRMKRVVALKVLPPSYARDDSAVLRFQREVQAVARLGHPNIVAALDADVFNGLHFFAMEYVEGSDLTRLVREKGPLPVDQAVAFVTQAAQGLKAAHDKGIYHRDIKPSNLILDTGGTVKILDLGLARMEKEADHLGSDDGASESGLTRSGAMMGTVSFMPPEQAYNSRDADHRSDIYSLGCTLYFLLTGKPPYSGATSMACLLAHREQPIPLLRDIRPEVPPILDDILRRMLAKAPEDRYQAIDALIADLEAAAPCAPVPVVKDGSGSGPAPETSPPSGTSVWRVAAVVAVVLVAFLAAVVFIVVAGHRRRVPPPVDPIAPVPVLRPPDPPPPPAQPKKDSEPIKPVGEVRSFRLHDEETRVQSIAVATDDSGRTFALSVGDDRTVRYWDVATGEEFQRFAHDGAVFAGAFSAPDHHRALSAGFDRTLRLWNLDNGMEEARFAGHEKPIYGIAFSPDGLRVLSGSGDGTIRLWDVATSLEIDRVKHDRPVESVAFSPVGLRALSGSDDKTVRLWDFWGDKGKEIYKFDGPAAVLCVAYSPDGHRALSGGSDGALTFWNLDRGREIQRFEGPQDHVRCVVFLPDGRHALSGTQAGKLIVWDLENGREAHCFEGTAGHLGVAVLRDGRHALTSDADGFVRLWKLPEPIAAKIPPEGGPAGPIP